MKTLVSHEILKAVSHFSSRFKCLVTCQSQIFSRVQSAMVGGAGIVYAPPTSFLHPRGFLEMGKGKKKAGEFLAAIE